MRILFITHQLRFWLHFTPVIQQLTHDGHHALCAIPGRDRDGPSAEGIACTLSTMGADITMRPRKSGHIAWLKPILAQKWSAIVICAEHMAPMNLVRPLVHKLPPPHPPVITMEHGLSQAASPQTHDRADHIMVWGRLGKQIIKSECDPGIPIHITGSPRFSAYTPENTHDDGFVLAIAGHVHATGGRITPQWIARVQEKCAHLGRPIVVKVHPNDSEFTPPPDTDRLRFVPQTQHPIEYLRSCSAVYLDYPSTTWLEAACLGKPIILDGEAATTFRPVGPFTKDDALEPGDSVGRIIGLIEKVAIQIEGNMP